MRKRWRILGVVLVTILATFAWANACYEWVACHPWFESEDYDLRVLTMNVHSPGEESRQRAIADLLLRQDADIVQLNEIDIRDSQLLDSLMRQHYEVVVDRYARQRSGDIVYSRHPVMLSAHVKRSKKVGSRYKIRFSVGDRPLHLFVCHLSSNNGRHGELCNIASEHLPDRQSIKERRWQYRIAQANRVAEAVSICDSIEVDVPTIVMGDLNEVAGTLPLEVFSAAGMRDSWWEGGCGYGSTFHSGWMRLRIDHVLHNGGLVLKGIRVVDSCNLSDHNAVVAEFSLR